MQRRILRRRLPHLIPFLLTLALTLVLAASAGAATATRGTGTYRNPLAIHIRGDGLVESCADPTVIYGQQGEGKWYMYCTTDPLNGQDRNATGGFVFHLIPMFSSADLVNWTYEGDAFSARPVWAEGDAGLWAPEISYFNGQYYLYYVVTNTTSAVSGESGCSSDNAIGVATAPTPLGPWTPAGAPVVAPRRAGAGCNFFWTFDPDVLLDNGHKYIYYGSYYGGIQVRPLESSGLAASEPATQVTIPNRYEGAEVIKRGSHYYLFVSATNCCNGPLTGYSVFAGRSTSPLGPFVDREGAWLLAGRVGGTPAISMNGNRWVGTGHNTVFQDFGGQWWTIYHAVDREDPYFADAVGFTKRPALLDPLDWIDGWPLVRGGLWASDTAQQAPAAQPGDKSRYKTQRPEADRLGKLIFAEEFDGGSLGSKWSWVRQPAPGTYSVKDGSLRFNTQAADLFLDSNNASVLTAPLPNADYVVETRVKLNLPPEGCCFNYAQAGLVIYGDDDNFIKLVHVSIWETRQTEFAKEASPVPQGYPRYGNTVVGPPGTWTYLRIVKRKQAGEEQYTAYTSRDAEHWVRGGTWTHNLGNHARIGLVSMGGAGFTASFDYVRVYRLRDYSEVQIH